MKYKNYAVSIADISREGDVYVFEYVELNESGNAMRSGYIGYVPKEKIYGLETYIPSRYPELNYLFHYDYSTEKMGLDDLGLLTNNLNIDSDTCIKLSIQPSVLESYNKFISTFENENDKTKFFDRLIVEYQL